MRRSKEPAFVVLSKVFRSHGALRSDGRGVVNVEKMHGTAGIPDVGVKSQVKFIDRVMANKT